MVEQDDNSKLLELAHETGTSFSKMLEGHHKGDSVASAFTDQLRLGENESDLKRYRSEIKKKTKEIGAVPEDDSFVKSDLRALESNLRIAEATSAIIASDIEKGVNQSPGYLEANQETMSIIGSYRQKAENLTKPPSSSYITKTTIGIMRGIAKQSLNINTPITPTRGPITI